MHHMLQGKPSLVKPLSGKRLTFLVAIGVLVLWNHARAEWRSLGEFPGEESRELQKEGRDTKLSPPSQEGYRKKASWKALSENEWGRSFYDAGNIVCTEDSCGGRIRVYLSKKYIQEKLPKLCKQIQGVRILEYRVKMNCVDKSARIVSADFYSRREKRVASVPLFLDVETSRLEASDAAVFRAFHTEVCR